MNQNYFNASGFHPKGEGAGLIPTAAVIQLSCSTLLLPPPPETS